MCVCVCLVQMTCGEKYVCVRYRETWLKASHVCQQTVERVRTKFLSQSAEVRASCKSRGACSTTNSVEDPATGNESLQVEVYTGIKRKP